MLPRGLVKVPIDTVSMGMYYFVNNNKKNGDSIYVHLLKSRHFLSQAALGGSLRFSPSLTGSACAY